MEAGRHDADHRAWNSIEEERFVENFRVAAEFGSPELIAHYKNFVSARCRVTRRETASRERGNSVEVKKIGRDRRGLNDARNSSVIEKDRVVFRSDHIFQNSVLKTKSIEFVGRKESAAFPAAGVRNSFDAQCNGAIEIFVRKCSKKRVVVHAEYNCGRGDTEGEREQCNREEARLLSDLPDCEPGILNK